LKTLGLSTDSEAGMATIENGCLIIEPEAAGDITRLRNCWRSVIRTPK
jgi:hypothetical protein